MNRFVVIVLDGFGMGAMDDVAKVRPQDKEASTFGSILKDFPDLKLPTLEKMGLMNAFGKESNNMKFSTKANFGRSSLMHYGADTFMGHQEIMGTKPKKPLFEPFQINIDKVAKHLLDNGHKVKFKENNNLRYIICDDYVTIADNLEADLGMAYNVTAPLDFIDFDKELLIGKLVREVVHVGRVIVFGGRKNTMLDLLNAETVKEGKYIGIDSSKSKSYENDYHVAHLGYGVNSDVQTPTILNKKGVPVVLIGKVQDIVKNNDISIPCVQTSKCFKHTIEEFKKLDYGFICTNIQETDLSGHAQSTKKYKDILELSDMGINKLISDFTAGDYLIVMADHGNDPKIGHSKHTREYVPLLVYSPGICNVNLGTRKSLSDVGATVADFFNSNRPENGESFLNLIK